MKKCFFYMLCAILLAAAVSLTSCSLDESNEPAIDRLQDQAALTESSDELILMQRTANNDGSWDNIIDGSSCFSIRFPYIVTVNQIDITIDSIEDIQLVEDIFDAFEEDEDFLDIVFPVTLIGSDYSEIDINSQNELRNLVVNCVEGGNDEDIECIDFIYPINLFVFNSDFERTSSVTVANDSEMRRFFIGLEESDLVGVDYPISFEIYDNSKITVDTNAELLFAIQGAIDSCDEDDDNDYGDDDFTKDHLDDLLIECPWSVDELKRDNQYGATDFDNYILNFKEDGSVIAQDRQGNSFYGEWSNTVAEYRVVTTLYFEFSNAFDLEWLVDDIGENRIKLFTAGDNRIVLSQYCEAQTVACNEIFIEEALSTCRWAISDTDSSAFNPLNIDFSNMNIHVYDANGELVDEGNWAIEDNTLSFNGLSMAFANYLGEWEVVECSAVRFKLEREDETFVIEKLCE